MTYTPEKPPLPRSVEELRSSIPGWGVDLDPKDRPSVPRERFAPEETGAHWEFPERQPEKWPRERSIEHKFLTPVFGTSTPLRGLSGAVRRFAYKFSEAQAAHWLILLGADRLDALEHHVGSLLTAHPDNPITETGVRAEFTRGGLSSRLGKKRADVTHHAIDPIVVAGPWVAAIGGAVLGARAVVRGLRR